ncbi:MAG: FHA domain-containing protein [Myxococcota bacterium]
MARYRLRYGSTDLEMPLGDFVVGRSSSCSLALDDGLVSRRHALLRVSEGSVTVEDLGSRNGISVNGKRADGVVKLKHLDRITIGNQELVVLERSSMPSAQTVQFERCFACGALCDPGADRCLQCGASLQQSRQTLTGDKVTIQSFPAFASTDEDEATQTTSSFSLLAPIAEKALALGRYEEASRLLGPSLDRLKMRAEEGKTPTDDSIDRGIALALRVSEGPTVASRWIAWVFDLHALLERPMARDTIDRLHELVRRVRFSNPRPLRAYLQVLRGLELTPAQRFDVRRLEALERVITA